MHTNKLSRSLRAPPCPTPPGLTTTFLEPTNGLFWVGAIYTDMNQVRAEAQHGAAWRSAAQQGSA